MSQQINYCKHGDHPGSCVRCENGRLRDALNGCIDWIKENCPDPAYPYCITEANAALRGISVVAVEMTTITQREFIDRTGGPDK